MLSPSHILHLVHPNVTSAYIKQDLENDHNGKQVLVLETDLDTAHTVDEEDKYLDLLIALEDIKRNVELQFGDISRVDIRGATCH